MKIQDKSIVSINFKLTNEKGEVIDSSDGQEPLVYMHGTKGLIPGLERELDGRSAGDKFQAVIQPEDGYGEVRPELIRNAKPEAFNGMDDIEAGMTFTARGPEGQVEQVYVEEVTEAGIKVNANHPLAGQVLTFDVSVKEVRRATVEELNELVDGIDD